MSTTEPLTGATVYNNNDQALGGQQIGDVVGDLTPFVIPRFTTIAARDSAYASYVAGGGVIKNGMTCWSDAPGTYYDRIAGAWVPRPVQIYNTTDLDSIAVPATARIVRIEKSAIVTIFNGGGGFAVPFGFTYTKLMSVRMMPGDSASGLGMTVPIVANHSLTEAQGKAIKPDNTPVPTATNIRVELTAIGYIL